MNRRLLTEVMSEYFEDSVSRQHPSREFTPPFGLTSSNRLPVTPKSNQWAEDRERRCLTRKYEFDSHGRMSDFIRELLDYESETDHYGRIECDFPTVTLSVKTHDVDDVTEVDRDYASQCDRIYDDVGHYGYGARDEIY